MKNINKKYITNINPKTWGSILAICLLMMSGCDKGFDDLNINKTAALAINPVFTLNNATVNASFPRYDFLLHRNEVRKG